MLAVLILVIAIGFLFLVHRPAGAVTHRALIASERYYAVGAILPILLCFAIPGILTLTLGEEFPVRLWSNRLSTAGLWLSLGLTPIGILLLRRASRRNGPPPGLVAAVGLAAIPGFLAVVVITLRSLLA